MRSMAETGIDICYVIRFDEERSLQSPEEFVRDVVVGTLGARAMVVGEDFHFGHRRRGDTAVTDARDALTGSGRAA